MKRLVFILMASASLLAISAPVEFDTEAVHVVVVRPLDAWSGDASNAEARLDALREKKTYYGISLDDITTGKRIHVRGGAAAFGLVSKHPFAQAGRETLLRSGFSLSQDSELGFDIEYPISINPSEWADFTRAQSDNFKNAVIAQGDPATLQSRTRSRKFLGGLFAAATVVAGIDKFGAATGVNATLGSGIANDAYRITTQAGQALAPVRLPAIDLSMYQSIDVRRLTNFLVPTGQLVFAYRAEKTPEAELDALLKSIVVIAGTDTTPEAVIESRKQDYEARLAIWKACVAQADPRCKAE